MVRILLEGRPGAGKTTVARRLLALLRDLQHPVAGFTTAELRERGRRVGFAVESVSGARGTLAHVRLPGPPRVARYGVDLEGFERVALPALGAKPEGDGARHQLEPGASVAGGEPGSTTSLAELATGTAVIIDELGKMELLSEAFRRAVARVFERDVDVVATVHVFRHPFTDALKARPGIELITVTNDSRDHLPHELFVRLSGRR